MTKQLLKERLQELAGIKSLNEQSLSDGDKRAIQVVVGEYSLNKVLNTIAVIAGRIGKDDEADMIKKLADQIQNFDPKTGINLNPTDLD